MRKTLTYSSFIIIGLLIIAAFVTATTYTQLAGAILLYPLLAYFAFKIFPHKNWQSPILTIKLPNLTRISKTKETKISETRVAPAEPKQGVTVTDIDKRAFLKLIGGVGLSFFLSSLLGRWFEGIFGSKAPGPDTVSLKDTTGQKIDPVQKQPTDGYRITEIDDNIITYYGFTNKDGAWFIMKEDTENGSFRYTKGDFNFASGWTSREQLRYDYFNNVF